MVKKPMLMLSAAILGLSVLAGCGGNSDSNSQSNGAGKKSDKVVQLKFFNGSVEMADWYNQKTKEFNDSHPGIQVEHQFLKEGTSALQVKFASGDIPDITNVVVQEFVDAGKFVDLSDSPFWKRIDPEMKELAKDAKTGKNFHIPTNKMGTGVYYNEALYKELGLKPADTWEQFEANLRVIKEKKPDIIPWFVSGKEGWTMGMWTEWIPDSVLKQKVGGSKPYRELTASGAVDKLEFDKPGGPLETFIASLLEFQKDGLINKDVLTASYDNATSAIANGKTAHIMQGMWAMTNVMKANPNTKDIAIAPFPAMTPDVKPAMIVGTDSSYYITTDSKHPEEAKAFLEWLFSPENQKSYTETRKAPSAFTDVKADWGILAPSATKAMERAVNLDWSGNPSTFNADVTGKMFQELFAGKYTPQEFAAAFKKGWLEGYKALHK